MVQFNKMFVMIPAMLAARKLDSEDPTTVYYLRIAYGIIQTACLLAVAYTYYKATLAVHMTQVVYVPPPPQPFAQPDAKKKYTETTYGAHVLSTARSLLGSTLFGVAMTLGLHYYRGMVMGLAMQAIMAPLNLAENALVKALFLKQGVLRPEDRIFDEKIAAELTADDEVVDEQGNPVVRSVTAQSSSGSANNNNNNNGTSTTGDDEGGEEKKTKSLEDILLDTWDAGTKADIGELMSALTKKNCNYQTVDDKWTALMILAGLQGVPGVPSAIRQVQSLGGNAAIVDRDGWTALHWAAFHGSADAAKELAKTQVKLLTMTDNEGMTPIELAKKEKNDTIAAIYEEALGESKKDK